MRKLLDSSTKCLLSAALVFAPTSGASMTFEIDNSEMTPCGDGRLCVDVGATVEGSGLDPAAFALPLPTPDSVRWTPIEGELLFAMAVQGGGLYDTELVRSRENPPYGAIMSSLDNSLAVFGDGGVRVAGGAASAFVWCGLVPADYDEPSFPCSDGNGAGNGKFFGRGELAWSQGPLELRETPSIAAPLPIPGTEHVSFNSHVAIHVVYTADEDDDSVENPDDNCRAVSNAAQSDADADGRGDVCDNCPSTPNPDQADRGGIGSSEPDGIGDECQCGDTNGNGSVTVADGSLILRSLLSPPAASLAKPNLCDVGGSRGCTPSDAAILMRALLSPARAQISDQCVGSAP